jgi:hypothetical protein
MSRRYRRVVARLRLSMALTALAVGSIGVAVGSVLTTSAGSWNAIATTAVLAGGSGYVLATIVRPTSDDIRDVTGDES